MVVMMMMMDGLTKEEQISNTIQKDGKKKVYCRYIDKDIWVRMLNVHFLALYAGRSPGKRTCSKQTCLCLCLCLCV